MLKFSYEEKNSYIIEESKAEIVGLKSFYEFIFLI